MGILLLQTIVPSLWSMPSARMQSQARKLLRHMGLYLLRVQSFHHAPVQIQSMQRQSIHRVRHVEGMHVASDDQSIMMFPVPLHQRQEAASPFYMCHAVGQCWVLPPASSMCILTGVLPKPHESHSMCLHAILELCVQSSACVRVSLMIVSLHRMIMHLEFHSTDFMSPFFVHIGSSIL